MQENGTLNRWGALCALASGLTLIAPLIFTFFLLPAAGSSATHAADPTRFLPWMAGPQCTGGLLARVRLAPAATLRYNRVHDRRAGRLYREAQRG